LGIYVKNRGRKIMLKIFIKKDWSGGLGFSFFTVGHKINEQWIYRDQIRIGLNEGEITKQPTFFIDSINANEFMLALKEAIREYEGSTPDFAQGELKATKYHLEDMRKIVDGYIGLENKNE
jgi:hypothetical protein